MRKFWPHFSGVSTGRVQIAFITDEGRQDLKSERYTVAKTSSRFCREKWGGWGELSPCHSAWKVVGCCYVVGWWFPFPPLKMIWKKISSEKTTTGGCKVAQETTWSFFEHSYLSSAKKMWHVWVFLYAAREDKSVHAALLEQVGWRKAPRSTSPYLYHPWMVCFPTFTININQM